MDFTPFVIRSLIASAIWAIIVAIDYFRPKNQLEESELSQYK